MFKTKVCLSQNSIVWCLHFVPWNKMQNVLSHWYVLWWRGTGGCDHVFSLFSIWIFTWNVQASNNETTLWAASSEFVSSSIPSWQILTAHAQSFRVARDLAFCLKVPLDSLLVWASSGGSGETARMRRLAWTFAARIGDKYQIRLKRPTVMFFRFCFVSLLEFYTTLS